MSNADTGKGQRMMFDDYGVQVNVLSDCQNFSLT